MTFDDDKGATLSPLKKDRSRKGAFDEEILPLLRFLNAHPDYYTTSSCAGRILLMTAGGKKHDSEWLLAAHQVVAPEAVQGALARPPAEQVWLRMESFIVHTGCRTARAAEAIVRIAREVGLKRAGIIGIHPRILVEIIGNERLDVPIAERGGLLVSEPYLAYLVRQGNEKLRMNSDRLNKLLEALRTGLAASG